MKIKPSTADMETAAEWLRCNEGDEGEAGSCHRVADWLDAQADKAMQREVARESGIPVKVLRKRLAARVSPKHS